MTKPVYILNGPNLNLLGVREPEHYGHETLADIEKAAAAAGERLGFSIVFRQTNHEGELISQVHEAREKSCGILINAGGYTHTSVALHDSLRMADVPVVEVHLSNIYKREPFRHHSYVSPAALGVICGFGGHGYVLAIEALAQHIKSKGKK